MPVVVDPNAPETFKEKILGLYTSCKTVLINSVFLGALVYVVSGAPSWFSSLTHTFVWIYIPILALCVAVFLVLSLIISMNKEDMIKATDEKARELSRSLNKLTNSLKPKATTWINHVFTSAEVVLLYMAGWTVAGAFVLILSLIFLLLRKSIRNQVQEVAMAKLSRE